MVFMVVVMLVPLHHLSQSSFIKQHTGQVPHLFLLHHRSWWNYRAQSTRALVLLGPLLVLAVRGCGLERRGLAGQSRRCCNTSAPHYFATVVYGWCAAVGLGGTECVFPWVQTSWPRRVEAVQSNSVHNSLQPAVVGMGVAVFWFMGAWTSLVGGAVLVLSLCRLWDWSCDKDKGICRN